MFNIHHAQKFARRPCKTREFLAFSFVHTPESGSRGACDRDLWKFKESRPKYDRGNSNRKI